MPGCYNQANIAQFSIAESWLFWIAFDVGFDEKGKKTLIFSQNSVTVLSFSQKWRIFQPSMKAYVC